MKEIVTFKRLSRWCLISGTVGGAVFVLAGTWRDPWLWTFAVVWSALALYGTFSIDEDLARERFHPPTAGADGLALHFVRVAALAHLVIGALDVGRWHLTASVPAPLRACALAAMAIGFGLFFRAMRENRFFSSVIRVQSDRGHRVIDTGPYAVIRHPGYAGMLLGIPFSGLALGSWGATAIGTVLSLLTLRRVIFEDGFLTKNLNGYALYADRVRHRLIPGVW
jgi:protein-S-isoprenylcysteine O-methyltransferase Ste14